MSVIHGSHRLADGWDQMARSAEVGWPQEVFATRWWGARKGLTKWHLYDFRSGSMMCGNAPPVEQRRSGEGCFLLPVQAFESADGVVLEDFCRICLWEFAKVLNGEIYRQYLVRHTKLVARPLTTYSKYMTIMT